MMNVKNNLDVMSANVEKIQATTPVNPVIKKMMSGE